MKTIFKFWSILSPAEKTTAIGLIAMMFVGMLLEMFGIGIIVPALTVLSGDKFNQPSPAIQEWLDWLGKPSKLQIILGGLCAFFAFYSLKAAFLIFAHSRQLWFVSKLESHFARRLFTLYLTQPWAFHLQCNSSVLMRNLEDTTLLANTFTLFLSTAAELLVLSGVLGLLVWFEPAGAIAVGVLMAIATLALERLVRKRIIVWGQQRQHHAATSKQSALQGLNGAKDISVLGRHAWFIEQFSQQREGLVRAQTKHLFVAGLPRPFYELVAIAALCVLTAIMAWQGKNPRAMIPTLGLFAAAAFRILPSVNRLTNALNTLRFSTAIIDRIEAELRLEQGAFHPADGTTLRFAHRLSLENVGFRYAKGHASVLDGIDIVIPHGSSVGLIGGSGAGKSTLVDIVLGLLAPTSGRVTVDGVDISTNLRGWQNLVGYVPQAIYLCDDTLRRNIAFGIPEEKIDDAAVARALRAARLDGFVAELPEGLQTVVGERGIRLSGGQRQRVGIARALYHDPEILVLDEATSSLDHDTEQDVMKSVEALQGAKTLLIVAHRLSTVAKCDRLYRLEHGHVVQAGTFTEVVLHNSLPVDPRVAAPAP